VISVPSQIFFQSLEQRMIFSSYYSTVFLMAYIYKIVTIFKVSALKCITFSVMLLLVKQLLQQFLER